MPPCLSLDIWLVPADVLLELQQLRSKLDLRLEEILGIHIVGGRIAAVLLNVQSDRGSRRAGTRESHDNTAARRETGKETLVRSNRAVEISV